MIIIHNKTLETIEAAKTIYDFDALGFDEGKAIKERLNYNNNINSPVSITTRSGEEVDIFHGSYEDATTLASDRKYKTRLVFEK